MGASVWSKAGVAVMAFVLGAAAPPAANGGGGDVAKHRPGHKKPFELRNLKGYPINTAYTNDALNAGCNTKAGAVPASNVVTLHLSAAQLGHLGDQASCNSDNGTYNIASCLVQTHAVQKCNADNSGCIDDDGQTNAVAFPKITAPTGYANYNTPFDISLINHWKTSSGVTSPWLLKISLDDGIMSFYPGSNSTDPTLAIQRGSANGPMFDCMQPIAVSGKVKSIELRVTQQPLSGAAYVTDSLNIGVIVTDPNGLKTPVIIDPKMQNNG